MIEWCIDQHSRGHSILTVTGRDAWARELTEQWLLEHLPVPFGGLQMRPDGDFRSNTHVKREIHSQLALTYEIRAAIDDDPEIVELWQELGIPVTMVLHWGEVVVAHADARVPTAAGPRRRRMVAKAGTLTEVSEGRANLPRGRCRQSGRMA